MQAFGGQHALIHAAVPVVANVGYLVAGSIYHPGDSFVVPPDPVDTVLVPTHAPWSKIAEVLDFVIAMRANTAFQVHDALLNDLGVSAVEAHVNLLEQEYC